MIMAASVTDAKIATRLLLTIQLQYIEKLHKAYGYLL